MANWHSTEQPITKQNLQESACHTAQKSAVAQRHTRESKTMPKAKTRAGESWMSVNPI